MLTDGDRVLVDKFVYSYRDPARWEPVVFRYPLRRTDPYVKRCVALPGEEVLIVGGDVYVRETGSGKIMLQRKTPRSRDELWLPILEDLDSNVVWVTNFLREGDVDFKDGQITLKGGAVVFFPARFRQAGQRDGPRRQLRRDRDAAGALRQARGGGLETARHGDAGVGWFIQRDYRARR
jgi:signal peptidase I